MATSQTTLTTEFGMSYLKRLCKHWSHRFETEIQESSGRVDFGEGKLVTFEAPTGELTITITAELSSLDKLEEVVAAHLERFATKETLRFDWSRSEAVETV